MAGTRVAQTPSLRLRLVAERTADPKAGSALPNCPGGSPSDKPHREISNAKGQEQMSNCLLRPLCLLNPEHTDPLSDLCVEAFSEQGGHRPLAKVRKNLREARRRWGLVLQGTI